MKINVNLKEYDCELIADALGEEAIRLRTNQMTGIVMPEEKFLNSDISEGRRKRYLACMDLKFYFKDLAKMCR